MAVIIFVVLAMSMCSSAFFSYSTRPESACMSIAALAETASSARAGIFTAKMSARLRTIPVNFLNNSTTRQVLGGAYY